jgi:hypothetical protein
LFDTTKCFLRLSAVDMRWVDEVSGRPGRRDVWVRHRLLRAKDMERVGRLPPEVKVNMTIDMTDAMVRVCAEGMKAQSPNITDEEMMKRLQDRFKWAKRWQKRVGR